MRTTSSVSRNRIGDHGQENERQIWVPSRMYVCTWDECGGQNGGHGAGGMDMVRGVSMYERGRLLNVERVVHRWMILGIVTTFFLSFFSFLRFFQMVHLYILYIPLAFR